MKLPSAQQGQTCTPGSTTATANEKQPAARKSNWQRYLDGDWNPMRKPSPAPTDASVKCNY